MSEAEAESLGESLSWREFRARLVAQGRAQTSEPAACSANAAVLRQRSAWQLNGDDDLWAHPTNLPEVGGLLCAMPLQAQIAYQLINGHDGHAASSWVDELGRRLDTSLGGEQQRCEESSPSIKDPSLLYAMATRMADEAFKTMGLSLTAAGTRRSRLLWQWQQRALAIRRQVVLVIAVADGLRCTYLPTHAESNAHLC